MQVVGDLPAVTHTASMGMRWYLSLHWDQKPNSFSVPSKLAPMPPCWLLWQAPPFTPFDLLSVFTERINDKAEQAAHGISSCN